jgi:uncharacterized membrane protein HdeD (DUF308 family)
MGGSAPDRGYGWFVVWMILGAAIGVVYINRDPGDRSPWPWLVVGLGLVIAGAAVHRAGPRMRHPGIGPPV